MSRRCSLHGYWFEFRTRSLFEDATGENVEVKALAANDGLSKDEQDNLTGVLNMERRTLAWQLPIFTEIRDATMMKKGKSYCIIWPI